MEVKSPYSIKFELPETLLNEFYCDSLKEGFFPSDPKSSFCSTSVDPSLISVNLYQILDWLHGHELPRSLEKEVCPIPVLLYVPKFTLGHLLFHYDGTPTSAELIRNFIRLFYPLIGKSKATIISPSFIPKSKIKEEQELIQLVSSKTHETSFIKFNFHRIGDFWSYGVKHDCTLLVTSKGYQADLAKILFHFYKGQIWSDKLSFYLSL